MKNDENIIITRNTKETQIDLNLKIYGSGVSKIDTKIGFFNHMLEALSKHSLMDMNLICNGDIDVDYHHSVEDCGIILGQALKSIYPVKNIERYGNSAIVMDESCVECDLDICNRAFLVFDMKNAENGFVGTIGSFNVELVEEFFRAVTMNANISVHLTLKRGKNLHHITEACFKAFAISLRRALSINERIQTPSTKGVL